MSPPRHLPGGAAGDHMPALAARFIEMHPDIRIDVAPGHGAVDRNKQEAEIAIRATKAPPETAFGRNVCPFRFALCAAPDHLDGAPERPLAAHRFCLIEGSGARLVPSVWKTKDEGEDRAVVQCRAFRAVQKAGAEGLGLTILPCHVGDADARLIRVSDPIESLDMDLWVLTDPDLRNAARIRATMSFLCDARAADADLRGGVRKAAGRWNLIPGENWRAPGVNRPVDRPPNQRTNVLP